MAHANRLCTTCKTYKPVDQGYTSGPIFYCSNNCLVKKAIKSNRVSSKPYKSKEEKEHLTLVASLGCVACRIIGHQNTPAEIHHIREGQGISQKADHFHVIPLCPYHHRTGPNAIHKSKINFERDFATETELLTLVDKMIEVVKECT
jgi:hypothetical protein